MSTPLQPPNKTNPVIVIGGGWAGLSAAVELARNDIPVLVLEAAKQLGGRARRIPFRTDAETPGATQTLSVDNGQHLLVGAYDSTLSLLHTIGVDESEVLRRRALNLAMLARNTRSMRLKAGALPAPLHLAWGLATAKGLSLKDRFNALRFANSMAKSDFTIDRDEPCADLLQRHRQSPRLIQGLWDPLCLAGLNTSVEQASAEVFLRMLRETFAYSRNNAHLLYTIANLSQMLPDPALDFIERNQGSIRLGNRVTGFQINDNRIQGIQLADHSLISSRTILATGSHISARLLEELPDTEALCSNLNALGSNPICTVYLQYPKHIRLSREMFGMIDTTSQWVFDRRICGQPGMMAVVISGKGKHMEWENEHLIKTVTLELGEQFKRWPAPLHAMVVREKRATFDCRVGINALRPTNTTPIDGLWLAGDYTDTGLPATLEGAVRSGIRAAKAVLKHISENDQ